MLASMRESDLLGHIYARTAGQSATFPGVLVGPGDDAAVVKAGPGDLVLTVDQLIERRHFRGPIISDTQQTPIDLVTRKAIGRSLSDLAAMAAKPVCCLATVALPARYPQVLADRLFDGMHKWAEHWKSPLVGGDIASYDVADAALTMTVTAVGLTHPARGPVTRRGAQPGDHIYVTGRLGGSFDKVTGLGRHLLVEPRVVEAAWLADTLGQDLHAMIDISDGLGRDSGRVAAASGVRLEMDSARLPLSPDIKPGPDAWLAAVRDGEDYELLFCVAPSAAVPPVCPASGTPFTRIGAVVAGEGCAVKGPHGRPIDSALLGWDHG